MPIYPSEEQFRALASASFEGPVQMLNLLKFKERAEYEDGRETNLTGREAYALYAEKMIPFVAEHGGRLVHSSEPHLLMIGDGGLEWDMVGIVEYPTKEAFLEIVQRPEAQPTSRPFA